MRRPWSLAATAVALSLAAPAVAANQALAAAPPAYTSEVLHFAVKVGPGNTQACDVVGEIFRPAGATSRARVPSVLTTNGFGGSYTDQVGMAEALAARGYAVLTYSGLGFGGSGCKIYLDSPLYDGQAASQLVSYLGGAPGIAFTDSTHTKAAPVVDYVIHDQVDHAGHRDRYDPRVGMVGGSYGGEIQFAVADIDARVDTIVPMITWNDLAYSLAPNNAEFPAASDAAGDMKMAWAGGFSAEGVADGVSGAQTDPTRLESCPNFDSWVCPALASATTAGYPDSGTVAHLLEASVTSYMSRIRIPTLLIQGENDTLFNLNEAARTYRALVTQRTPVAMIWQSWGHSDSTPAPGEFDSSAPNPTTQYETGRIFSWFDHYLKGQRAASTGPAFAYFRDWVAYKGNAAAAYASAPSFPASHQQAFYLSSGQFLEPNPALIGVSDQQFLTGPAGAPTSTEPPDVAGGTVPPIEDSPGTYADWSGAPLASPLDVVGSPVLHLSVIAPTAGVSQAVGPAGQLVVFARLYDVAPDGTTTLIHGLVAPARIADVNTPITITLPGIVHRFAAGHRIELVVAGGDLNYRGGLTTVPVDIRTGSTGQVLDLPVAS